MSRDSHERHECHDERPAREECPEHPERAARGAEPDRARAAGRWSLYDLRISTRGEPGAGPAVRQLRVPGSLSLDDLHTCIALAFGWNERPPRRYVFELGDARYLPLEPDLDGDLVFDSEFTRLEQLGLRRGDVLRYVHDFAEFHIHHIVTSQVESTRRPDLRPRCVAGEGVALVGGAAFDADRVNLLLGEAFASLVPQVEP